MRRVSGLRLAGHVLNPYLERALGETRDLARFADVAGSTQVFVKLLALSWTVANFGIALFAQAIQFGAIDAYQGPASTTGAT